MKYYKIVVSPYGLTYGAKSIVMACEEGKKVATIAAATKLCNQSNKITDFHWEVIVEEIKEYKYREIQYFKERQKEFPELIKKMTGVYYYQN